MLGQGMQGAVMSGWCAGEVEWGIKAVRGDVGC